ncbi:hypothetical protein CFO_g3800 [Ceratocystis platani]|uniref:Uncharacterized protein n=1 Tax=Ceratocystis fimbriata f. sp. platani TaxID=88771 RepID=A0A0F8DCW5_CERFI|nr:hypothetical protein CFO_g3800 [Ceratocystis platani]
MTDPTHKTGVGRVRLAAHGADLGAVLIGPNEAELAVLRLAALDPVIAQKLLSLFLAHDLKAGRDAQLLLKDLSRAADLAARDTGIATAYSHAQEDAAGHHHLALQLPHHLG